MGRGERFTQLGQQRLALRCPRRTCGAVHAHRILAFADRTKQPAPVLVLVLVPVLVRTRAVMVLVPVLVGDTGALRGCQRCTGLLASRCRCYRYRYSTPLVAEADDTYLRPCLCVGMLSCLICHSITITIVAITIIAIIMLAIDEQ